MDTNDKYFKWMEKHPNITCMHPYSLDLMEAYEAGYKKAMAEVAAKTEDESKHI